MWHALAVLISSFIFDPYANNGLAREWIRQAESGNGTIDLSRLADAVCFVPESVSAPFFADRILPGYKISYQEKTDKSEGVWYAVLADQKSRSVRIYATDQSILRWNVPEETIVADSVTCRATIKINSSNGIFEMENWLRP